MYDKSGVGFWNDSLGGGGFVDIVEVDGWYGEEDGW